MGVRDLVHRLQDRTGAEWVLDLSGLLAQGVLVPAAAAVLAGILRISWPAAAGSLALPGYAAFAINFILIDYLYYWNHRLLHGALWRWHAVHHTARSMDVLVTARNTLWTPALIVYVWANATFIWLLGDARPYLLAAALSSVLDLWRHSEAWPTAPSLSGWHAALARVLITPRDHAWHHSDDHHDSNFGANLKVWDRIHGTLWEPGRPPESLGIPIDGELLKRLILP